MSDNLQAEERKRLEQLAMFVDRFREPSATFGEQKPGYFDDSELSIDFIQMAYEYGWVLRPFVWSQWIHGPEGHRLASNRDVLKSATSEQLAKLLTACIRQDRFVDGG